MNLRSIRIGRLAGIPIGVQPLWLLIVALITWSLGAVYYPDQAPGISPAAAYSLGLLSALLLFASILLHELGHAVVARRHGVEIEEIDLWLLGGVARMKGYPNDSAGRASLRPGRAGGDPRDRGGLRGRSRLALPSSTPASIEAVIAYQAIINTAILVFNMLPAFPLDGGRVARAMIWGRTRDLARATSTRRRDRPRLRLRDDRARRARSNAPAPSAASGLRSIGLFVVLAAKARGGRGEDPQRLRRAGGGAVHVLPGGHGPGRGQRRGCGRAILRSVSVFGLPGHRRRENRRTGRHGKRSRGYPASGGRAPPSARSRPTNPSSSSTSTRTWPSCSSAPPSSASAGQSSAPRERKSASSRSPMSSGR